MLRHHFGRIRTKLLQWRIEPFDENALNVVAIALDCEFAATLPDQVRVPVSFPFRRFPGPSALGSVMLEAGLVNVRYRLLAGGIVALHVGEVAA